MQENINEQETAIFQLRRLPPASSAASSASLSTRYPTQGGKRRRGVDQVEGGDLCVKYAGTFSRPTVFRGRERHYASLVANYRQYLTADVEAKFHGISQFYMITFSSAVAARNFQDGA